MGSLILNKILTRTLRFIYYQSKYSQNLYMYCDLMISDNDEIVHYTPGKIKIHYINWIFWLGNIIKGVKFFLQ